MLPKATSYQKLVDSFSWEIPEHYNIGVDVCDRQAAKGADHLAISFIDEQGEKTDYNFGQLRSLSNQLANLLARYGLDRGDRVGVLLPQTPETAITHIAAFKSGAISVPLFMLFGVDALEYRLSNAGIKMIITDALGAGKIKPIRDRLPELEQVFTIDGEHPGTHDLHTELAHEPVEFKPVNTLAEDPALIIYTSGTTGQPKGALHCHRAFLGHLPGVEMSHDLFPEPGDKIWTPADWAWIGGLLDVLMPALHHGVPVVACRFTKFTAEAAYELIEREGIRNVFLPPTALKLMRAVDKPQERWNLNLRTIASAGETLGTELLEWGQRTFGISINEFYGQTECNMIVSSCARIMPSRPGIMGPPAAGHDVDVIDDTGERVAAGELGNIAVRTPNPVMFLEYWKNPQATREKFLNGWMLTGDKGWRSEDGWLKFVGRDDDVITSSGYRIGPGEIEDSLIKHPAVKMAAVIGKPDPDRTEIVKAFIILKDGMSTNDELAAEIQEWVKINLAAHEYPREITFVDDLPLTTTGKIIRRELRELE